ncbi:hypothetical protein G6F54_014547 [Rhizopus delemar]|nr:hypothetical protein G6F54_014547 [Rhizopus delemar]
MCSAQRAQYSSRASSLTKPTIWKPSGRPLGPRATGNVMDGLCSRDQIRMNAELPVLLASGASPSVDGITTVSTSRATS